MHKYTNTTVDPAQMEIKTEEEEFSHWPPKLPTAGASAPWKSRATNSLRTRKCYINRYLHNFLKMKIREANTSQITNYKNLLIIVFWQKKISEIAKLKTTKVTIQFLRGQKRKNQGKEK